MSVFFLLACCCVLEDFTGVFILQAKSILHTPLAARSLLLLDRVQMEVPQGGFLPF